MGYDFPSPSYEFCKNWDFRNVNFGKIEVSMCEFWEIICIFATVCAGAL